MALALLEPDGREGTLNANRRRSGGIMRTRMVGLTLVLLLVAPVRGGAQVPWETPLLVAAGSPGGFSVFVVDPGWGLGVMGQWIGTSRDPRVGFRAGLADGPRDRLAAFGGVDLSGLLLSHNAEFPLDMVWVSGVGLGAGHDAIVTVPFGLALGRTLSSQETWFHPYFGPRIFLDAYLGDERRDDLDLGMAMDLGLDLGLTRGWVLRFGASVGDREGIAIGLAVPGVG
jgi:hypothetical protein